MNRSHLFTLALGVAVALPVVFLAWSPDEAAPRSVGDEPPPDEPDSPALATVVSAVPRDTADDSIWAGLVQREERVARTPLPTELFEKHPEIFGLNEDEDDDENAGAAPTSKVDEVESWLEGKSPSLAAYYQKDAVTAEEWARAYEEEMCACSTKECLMKARRDHERRSPPFDDKTTTEATRRSLEAAQICIAKGAS